MTIRRAIEWLHFAGSLALVVLQGIGDEVRDVVKGARRNGVLR